MGHIDPELLKLAGIVLVTILGSLGVGLGVRRRLSSDGVARARDAGEVSVYDTALVDTKIDRDEWRKSAERAWLEIAARDKLINEQNADHAREMLAAERLLMLEEQKTSLARSQLQLIEKIVRKYPDRYPDISIYLPSVPGPLDLRIEGRRPKE